MGNPWVVLNYCAHLIAGSELLKLNGVCRVCVYGSIF